MDPQKTPGVSPADDDKKPEGQTKTNPPATDSTGPQVSVDLHDDGGAASAAASDLPDAAADETETSKPGGMDSFKITDNTAAPEGMADEGVNAPAGSASPAPKPPAPATAFPAGPAPTAPMDSTAPAASPAPAASAPMPDLAPLPTSSVPPTAAAPAHAGNNRTMVLAGIGLLVVLTIAAVVFVIVR